MDWWTPIDIYCERVGTAFWAEPWNALSNASFIAAAIWGWVVARREKLLSPEIVIAILMAGLIGIGSFLFHTFATHWAELADVIPIWSFVAYIVVLSIHKLGGSRWGHTLRVVGIAAAVMGGLFWLFSGPLASDPGAAAPSPLNGSEQYAPALVALWAFALVGYWRGFAARRWMLASALVFSASLVARTLDLMLCEIYPTGTHWIWHGLNGLMIGLVLQSLLVSLMAMRTPR